MYRDCIFSTVCFSHHLIIFYLFKFACLHTCRLVVYTTLLQKTQSACGCFEVESDSFVCDTGFFCVFTCIILHAESICGSQFGCSSRSDSRLALFVLAQRRRHISLVDTPLLQGSYCGARGSGQQRLNSQFAVISLNLLVH